MDERGKFPNEGVLKSLFIHLTWKVGAQGESGPMSKLV